MMSAGHCKGRERPCYLKWVSSAMMVLPRLLLMVLDPVTASAIVTALCQIWSA
jgi:hypothetical protein